MLFIHAVNNHYGGGKRLLLALLGAIPNTMIVFTRLNGRFGFFSGGDIKAHLEFSSPSVWQRLKAEWLLFKKVGAHDVVLCFGSLPPLLKLRGRVIVFIQNRYIIDSVSLSGFTISSKVKIIAQSLLFKFRISNVDEFIVQTPSMMRALELYAGGKIPIHIWPFTNDGGDFIRRSSLGSSLKKSLDFFIYVASGEPHKNHQILIEAWIFLAQKGLFPTLKLTIERSQYPELVKWIDGKIKEHRLSIENYGSIPHERVLSLYKNASALIFPSTFESFGLPLIEAKLAGLPILASELDYVRDILDPEESFDPDSSISIARAVKRFLCVNEDSLYLMSPSQFLKALLKT
jgi:glycosyltransferase involved in cell wall biosynthesis